MTTRIKRGDIAKVSTSGDRFATIRREQRQWPTRRTPRVYSQDELRERRRHAHIVAYNGNFDLAAESEGVLSLVAAVLSIFCGGSRLSGRRTVTIRSCSSAKPRK